jgi:glycosyltransferase involved in cell wall biosynthesis
MILCSNNIVWVGSVFNDSIVLENIAVSPAGNKWQLNFINALSGSGVNVTNLGHCPQRVFPFGKFFVSKHNPNIPDNIKLICSSYLNLSIIRIIVLNLLNILKFAKFIKTSKNQPQYIISYNTYSYNVLVLLFAKFIARIKWISIIADPMYNNTNRINPFNSFSDGQIFLSYELFTSSRSMNKIHLDGGINQVINLNNNIFNGKEKVILYTGAISRHTGIELLINSFKFLRAKDIRLIICGKGYNEVLNHAAKENPRITYLGIIDEKNLMTLYDNAYIFVNPRLISEKTNRSNFPSKLLEYLRFCKPIVSTYTSGIHPDYKEVIQFIYNDDPNELAGRIDEILEWHETIYLANSKKMKSFVEEYKLWPKVMNEFHEWAKYI